MRKIMALASVLALAGCERGETPEPSSELTQRQADSALGASRLPGARGITGAMTAADSAAARSARLDSAGMEP